MSAAQTWFGRSIVGPRSRYGKILCPGVGFVVRGFGPSAAMPIRRISRCTRLRLTANPTARSSAVIRREPRKGQAANSSSAPHQGEVVVVRRPRRPINARARKAQERALPPDRQPAVIAIDERSAVRRAHLPDLRAKKSRSTISSPILACGRSISRMT